MKKLKKILSGFLAAVCVLGTCSSAALAADGTNITHIYAVDYGDLLMMVNAITQETPVLGPVDSHVHYDTHTNNVVYCANVNRQFMRNMDHQLAGQWENPEMYAAFSFVFTNSEKKLGSLNASAYSTGDSSRDWYATQMVVWELLHHFGIKDARGMDAGLDINTTTPIAGYENVYNVMRKLYSDALSYAASHKNDYSDPSLAFAASGEVKLANPSSDGSYMQTDWISLNSSGEMVSRNYSLEGAPEGAEIVYENANSLKSKVAVRIPVSKIPPAGKTSFTLKVSATYNRPVLAYLAVNDADAQELIVAGNTTTVTKNAQLSLAVEPVYGGVKIYKMDADTKSAVPQGDAALKEATFEIVNQSSYKVLVNGKMYAKGEVVKTITTDENGYAATAKNELQAGSYLIRESGEPTGYLGEGVTERTFKITGLDKGTLVDMTAADHSIQNRVIRGGIRIKKQDADYQDDKAQGDASLKKATFAIVNASPQAVVVGGQRYGVDEVVLTLTTGDTGLAESAKDALPYGTYDIYETDPSTGYLVNESWKETFSIRENGQIVDLTAKLCDEPVIRGGVQIEKQDLELQKPEALGGASLAGIEFTITNNSAQRVWVNGASYEPGKAVMTIVTDETGHASTAADALPYGTYTINETKTNDSYLLTDGKTYLFQIREPGVIVTADKDGGQMIYQDQVVRNDFHLNKIADTSNHRMGITAFLVTNTTTGEAHVIATDKNGVYNSQNKSNPHSRDTNINDALLEKYSSSDAVIPNDELTPKSGLWFGLGQNGSLAEVNDKLGALPYGEYRLQELRCEANVGYDLLDITFYVEEDTTQDSIIDLGTLTDDEQPKPEIGTTASAKDTGTNETPAALETTIVDTVSYKNLKPGEEYTMKGVLMDKETGEEVIVNGSPVIAEAVFTPKKASGTVKMEFTFDSTDLGGKDLVVFETLIHASVQIAEHKDIDDEDQTVTVTPENPEIGTTAVAKDTGIHETLPAEETTVVDTVIYKGLFPGKEYTVKGVLMDKETGEPLKIGDAEVTAELVFTPEETDGSVELSFTFNSEALGGKELVAFETLYRNDKEVAAHADIEDEDQTVIITPENPEINTTAVAKDTGTHETKVSKETTIVDTVEYKGLLPGKEYTVKGVLMDKKTGDPLKIDGKEVTAEKVFTTETANGSVEMEFTFDSSDLEEKELVVFETLYRDGKEIAVHADINDENQTVTVKPEVPKIRTNATAKDTGTHETVASTTTTIVDKVTYSHLIPGKEYTLTGVLMDKSTGKELTINGKTITVTKTFTPEKASGAVEMEFTIDTSALVGKSIVVFETLYRDGKEVAVHADINDADQTVTIKDKPVTPEPVPTTPSPKGDTPTKTPPVKTGDNSMTWLWLAVMIAAGAGIAGMAVVMRKRRS